MEKLSTFFDTKAGILLTIIAGLCLLIWALSAAGLLKGLRQIFHDWSTDLTGRHTINNGARILVLFAFLFVFIGVHFTVTLKPFHITPHALSEIEIAALLAFIIGAEWVKKPNIAGLGSTKTEVTSEGTTIINTAPQAAKPAPQATKQDPTLTNPPDVLQG